MIFINLLTLFPIGFEKDICGVVDLIDMKAYTYKDYTDHELTVGEIPADMVEKAKNARAMLVEEAVQADEQLMDKYFNEGEDAITVDELKAALRKRVLDGDFFLVTGGDGRGVIVEKVLDLMADYLPSPLDRDQGQTVGTDPNVSPARTRRLQPLRSRLQLIHSSASSSLFASTLVSLPLAHTS